jgi:hypothetical protein
VAEAVEGHKPKYELKRTLILENGDSVMYDLAHCSAEHALKAYCDKAAIMGEKHDKPFTVKATDGETTSLFVYDPALGELCPK